MSQLSLGEFLEVFFKWQESTAGRDKLLRLVAYFSKVIVDILNRANADKDTIQRIQKGASAVGVSRKLIRFFRSVEYVHEFVTSLSMKDETEKYLTLGKNASLAIWMLCDHIQWLNKAGYLKLASTKTIDEYHSKGWFFGLLLGIIISLYKLKSVSEELKKARQDRRALENSDNKEASQKAIIAYNAVAAKKQKMYQALLKNGVDIVIPAARLEWLPVSDAVVGVAGTITSIIGIRDTWPKSK